MSTTSASSLASHTIVLPVFHSIPSADIVVADGAAESQKQHFYIGTHDGTFHCDEALACALLSLLPQYHTNAAIVRTRDVSTLEKCDLICDVGAVYDPAKQRFDHHQGTFKTTLEESGFKTRLSSAGLIYKHFGRSILETLVPKEYHNYLDVLYVKMYENFMEHIDAIDNGIEVSEGGPLRYKITTTLSNRVSRLNPSWTLSSEEARAIENQRFQEAMKLTGGEFVEVVRGYVESWLPARDIVEKAMQDRFKHDASGEIIVLEKFCPWKDHLLDIEKEQGQEGLIKYCIYQDVKGSWRIQCVPLGDSAFANRLSLPADWRGLRDDELSEKSGIPGGIFVHASGFIGGNKTFDGVMRMAKMSLEMGKSIAKKD